MKYKMTVIIETSDKNTIPTKEELTEYLEENLLFSEESISSTEIEELKN